MQIGDAIERLKVPLGTKESPARTCKELSRATPTLENGMYWIDPNQGSADDAIEVYCDIKKEETCIFAQSNQVEKGKWYTGPSKRTWFSVDMENGFTFSYNVDKVQLKFLQALSNRAHQNVTYHCRNSVAYFDDSTKTHDKAIVFMASTNHELVPDRPIKFKYSVSLDECQYRQDKWTRTVFEFKTGKPRRLPILDLAPTDVGQDNQAFGVDIGPACYS